MNKLETTIKLILVILLFAGLILMFNGGCATWCGWFNTNESSKIVDTEPEARLAKAMLQLNWMVTASIAGAALAFVGVLQGSKLAQAILIACVIALGLSLAAIRYAEWLAIGSLVSAGAIMLATVVARGRAIKELILGVQKLKGEATVYKPNEILQTTQSKSTQSIVQQVKGKLKLKGII